MADFEVVFREEQRIPAELNTQNAYHWDVLFGKDEGPRPISFSGRSEAYPVTFEEEKINDSIYGGVSYVVHDYGDLPIATRQRLGCVIVGENLSVEPDGTLSADAAEVEALTNLEIEELLGGS